MTFLVTRNGYHQESRVLEEYAYFCKNKIKIKIIAFLYVY